MRKLITAALFALFTQSSLAGWTLDNDASTFNFLSTKKNTATESHTFKQLSGSINDEGSAVVSVKLASVETNITIRNERMQTFLFQIADFASATATLSVDPNLLKNLRAGERKSINSTIALNFHGITKKLPTELMVTTLENHVLQVHTVKPILLIAADFELNDGIEKLRTLAKLSTIDTTVPVTFTLLFQQDN